MTKVRDTYRAPGGRMPGGGGWDEGPETLHLSIKP